MLHLSGSWQQTSRPKHLQTNVEAQVQFKSNISWTCFTLEPGQITGKIFSDKSPKNNRVCFSLPSSFPNCPFNSVLCVCLTSHYSSHYSGSRFALRSSFGSSTDLRPKGLPFSPDTKKGGDDSGEMSCGSMTLSFDLPYNHISNNS